MFYTPKDEVWHGEEIVKVTDFGLSNSFKDNTMMNTWCGSLAYSAPEVPPSLCAQCFAELTCARMIGVSPRAIPGPSGGRVGTGHYFVYARVL